MVELVEVEDESFETKQVGPSDEDEYTDTGMAHCAAFQGSNWLYLKTLRFPPTTKMRFPMKKRL